MTRGYETGFCQACGMNMADRCGVNHGIAICAPCGDPRLSGPLMPPSHRLGNPLCPDCGLPSGPWLGGGWFRCLACHIDVHADLGVRRDHLAMVSEGAGL